ncbi:MAG: hypothetical protein HRT35_00170 [Algicola sp.]|nr:hypothetical protein [Algicola sp.]
MQQLKSLLCFSGSEQSSRFGVIQSAVYLCFFLLSLLLASVPALFFVVVLVLAVFATASSVRRVRDAGLAPMLSAIPIGVYVVCATLISSIGGSSYFLLILAVLSTVGLMLCPSRQRHDYIQGYHGPVDLSSHQAKKDTSNTYANRIEPTFVASHGTSDHSDTHNGQIDEHFSGQTDFDETTSQNNDWIEPLKSWVLANQKVAIAAFGFMALLSLVLATLPMWSSNPVVEEQTVATPEPVVAAQKVRLHKLEMPNNYYLMTDENQGLLIHWPAYAENDNPALWSILTAKGEPSCENLRFSDNTRFRTNLVEIENAGDHYASFSPLDTEALVKAIAAKSNFSLCGYEFSLKGSTAAINSSPIFSVYLESL